MITTTLPDQIMFPCLIKEDGTIQEAPINGQNGVNHQLLGLLQDHKIDSIVPLIPAKPPANGVIYAAMLLMSNR